MEDWWKPAVDRADAASRPRIGGGSDTSPAIDATGSLLSDPGGFTGTGMQQDEFRFTKEP